MNRKRLLLFAALLCGVLFSACSKSDGGGGDPPAEAETWTPRNVDRAMLHYLAADGLRDFDATNISDMVRGATRQNIGNNVILVMHDRPARNTRLLAIFAGKDGDGRMDVVKEFDVNKDFSDPGVLVEAIGYLKEYAPSNSYVLAVGSHGSGWVPGSRSSERPVSGGLLAKHGDVPPGISPRSIVDDRQGVMEIEDFSDALAAGLANIGADKFDMILFDECLAAGVEVMYEVKDRTRYATASVTETWINGMPYANIVGDIFSQDLVAGGRAVCDKFVGYYAGLGETSTMSFFDLSKFDEVSALVSEIVTAHNSEIDALTYAQLRGIQYYDMYVYVNYNDGRWVDFAMPLYWDLAEYLCAISPDSEHARIRTKIQPAAGNLVNYSVTTPNLTRRTMDYQYPEWTVDRSKFSGITSYIPTTTINDYRGLTNNKYKNTRWYNEVYP